MTSLTPGVHECHEGASNCYYICILAIVETQSRIIPYKENRLTYHKYC